MRLLRKYTHTPLKSWYRRLIDHNYLVISSKIVAGNGNRDHKVIMSKIVTIIVLIVAVIVLVTVVIKPIFVNKCLYMQGRLLIILIASLIDADARCSITLRSRIRGNQHLSAANRQSTFVSPQVLNYIRISLVETHKMDGWMVVWM